MPMTDATIRKQLSLARADLEQALSRISVIYNASPDDNLRDRLITLQTAIRHARDITPVEANPRWINVAKLSRS